MKKFYPMILSCALLLSLCACTGNEAAGDTNQAPKPETVENQQMTLSLYTWNDERNEKNEEPIERSGVYTGETLDGVPNGYGKFETRNSSGVSWYYEGEFENGLFNGEGGCYWPETGYQEVGHFSNGYFEPTETEFYDNAIRAFTSSVFLNTVALNSASTQFIMENEPIFPALTEEAKTLAKDLVQPDVGYKHLTKSIDDYLGVLFSANSQYVVQVREVKYWGHTMTTILLADSDFSNYQYAFYDGRIDIYDDDTVNIVSLPITNASFENIGGGVTNVVVTIASIVDKV